MSLHLKKMQSPGESLLNDPISAHDGYLPCTIPLHELQPIDNLLDLIVEDHHYGRVLVVKTFCDPVRIESLVNAVEDAAGNVDRLAIYNVSSTVCPDAILPRGRIFAIKEPFYRRALDGGVLIRVDHPSNVIMMSPADPLVPAAWRIPDRTFTVAERTDQAAEAMAKNSYHDADLLYTDALKQLGEDGDESVRRGIYRNRAYVRLRLGHCEIAAEDALKGVAPGNRKTLSKEQKDGNFAAYRLVGNAHYEMANFAEAKQYWNQAFAVPIDKAAKASVREDIERAEKRLKEQKTGVYDFVAMSKSATRDHLSLDHASFLSNTKIGPAGARGRGLFATKEISHGDIIMVEKAMFNIWADPSGSTLPKKTDDKNFGGLKKNGNGYVMADSTDYNQERVYDIWSKLSGSPRMAAAFLDLYDGDDTYYFKKDGKKTTLATNIDGTQVILDMFQIRAILDHNFTICAEVKSSLRMKYLPYDQEEEKRDEEKNDEEKDKAKENEPGKSKSKGKKKGKGKKNKGKQPAPAPTPTPTPAPLPTPAPTPAPTPTPTPTPASSSTTKSKTRDGGGASLGLWQRAAYINHSCLPNAYRSFIGDMMILRATRTMKAGDEILVHYIDSTWPYEERTKALASWNISRCDCPLCEVEASLPSELLEKRKRLQREVARFLEEDRQKSRFMRRPPCKFVQARWDELANAMRETYPAEVYDALPRFEMVELSLWLCETSFTPWEVIDSAQLLLRDMGIKTRFNREAGNMLQANRKAVGSGVVFECVLPGLLIAGTARRSVHSDRAKRALWKFRKIADQIHLILFAEELVLPPGLYDRPWGREFVGPPM